MHGFYRKFVQSYGMNMKDPCINIVHKYSKNILGTYYQHSQPALGHTTYLSPSVSCKDDRITEHSFRHRTIYSATVKPAFSRQFHTTPRRDISPILWMLLKPFTQLVSIIGGRWLRKRWKILPEKRRKEIKAAFSEYKGSIILLMSVMVTLAIINYRCHLQLTPITQRSRYIGLTPEQIKKLCTMVDYLGNLSENDKILTKEHPLHRKIEKVVYTILKANEEFEYLKDISWKIYIVDSDEINATAFPNGRIIVYRGIVDVCLNEDQLACVIAHELAHILLMHAIENLSMTQLLDYVLILVMAAAWFFMPNDGIAFVTNWFFHHVTKLMLKLPYSRKLESEADEVGLHLMAKACYDVRESSLFWTRMGIIKEAMKTDEVSKFLSTHPTNLERCTKLNSLIPEALNVRSMCKCPALLPLPSSVRESLSSSNF